MKVEVEKHGTVAVLVPADSIVEESLPDMREVAAEISASGAGARCVLDMSNVAFVDSAGIEFLLDYAGSGNGAPIQPRIAALNETVREALQITETIRQFSIYESVESAVRSYL